MSRRDRLGFVVHAADIYNHYRNVLRRLDRGRTELVLLPSIGKARQALVKLLDAEGFSHVELEQAQRNGWRYRYLVSNHVLLGGGGLTEPYLIERLGEINVRFMYALGKAKHNFSWWNRLYDVILCHGPYQIERLAYCHGTLKLQMGYPRYDGYAESVARRSETRKGLGLLVDRPVLLWLPTWRELSSIELHAQGLASLGDLAQVVVKPHPLTLTEEPERCALLRRLGFTIVEDELVDITDLYAMADWVAADYGGPIFSALYLDKPLLLLNVPAAQEDSLTGEDSPDVQVRKLLPSYSAGDISGLRKALLDDGFGQKQAEIREAVRRQYFAPYQGRSASVAAAYLENLDELIKPLGARRLGRGLMARAQLLFENRAKLAPRRWAMAKRTRTEGP